MKEKYVKPRSLTWWMALVPVIAGLVVATEPMHGWVRLVEVIDRASRRARAGGYDQRRACRARPAWSGAVTRGLGTALVLVLLLLAFEAGRRWDDAADWREAAKLREKANAIEDEVRGAADDDLVDGILRD